MVQKENITTRVESVGGHINIDVKDGKVKMRIVDYGEIIEPTMTPQEARRLASKLIAAAAVALSS